MNYKKILIQTFCAILFATCNVNCSSRKPFYEDGLSEIYDTNNLKYIVAEKFIRGEACTFRDEHFFTYYYTHDPKTGKKILVESDGVPVNLNPTQRKFIIDARLKYARLQQIKNLNNQKK